MGWGGVVGLGLGFSCGGFRIRSPLQWLDDSHDAHHQFTMAAAIITTSTCNNTIVIDFAFVVVVVVVRLDEIRND